MEKLPRIFRFGSFTLNERGMELRRSGNLCAIEPTPLKLLRHLIVHRDRVISRKELFDEVWGRAADSPDAVWAAVSAVRAALKDSSEKEWIHQTRGEGYQFVGEVQEESTPPTREQLKQRFGRLLDALWHDLRPLRLYGVRSPDAHPREVPVDSAYTSINILQHVSLQGEGAQGDVAAGKVQARLREALEADLRCEAAMRPGVQPSKYSRPVRTLEATAVFPRLVLVGPPGGGKSTFVQHLSACLLGEILGEDSRLSARGLRTPPVHGARWMPWEHEPWIPILIELRHFARSRAFPGLSDRAEAGHLFRYLEERSPGREDQCREVQEYLVQREGNGILLILDGLDEVPEAERCRERIHGTLRSFGERFPKARIIVTSRPHAYRPGSAWRLDREGLVETELAPFTPEQIEQFCSRWYTGAAERGQTAPESAAARASALWAELRQFPALLELAERPLMLTLLADLHSQRGNLPTNRAELLEESAALLLDRWNAARESGRPGENRLTDTLDLNLDALRRAVEALAYETQAAGAWSFDDGRVLHVLRAHGARCLTEILEFLEERSGILVAEARDQYRFPHRCYQEYLAACYLAAQPSPEITLRKQLSLDVEPWREVLPLVLSRLTPDPDSAWRLVDSFLSLAVDGNLAEDLPAILSILCARGLCESQLAKRATEAHRPILERVRLHLLRICDEGQLSLRDRADAGDLLGYLGDPRVSQVHWIPLSGMRFWMGSQYSRKDAARYYPNAFSNESPVHRVRVRSFEVSRFPITVSQYEKFIDNGGYQLRQHWDEAGWAAKEERCWTAPAGWDLQLRHPSRPVVGVSWYEARAFAHRQDARLPTEAEWERAAQGGRSLAFPWGFDFDCSRCNAAECGLDRLAPVGIFPLGRSIEGIEDLAGNIAEWVEDDWHDDYHGAPSDGSAWVEAPRADERVIRGGTWRTATIDWFMRASSRVPLHPANREDDLGFRLLRDAGRKAR